MYIYVSISIYLSISLSLSLSIYLYIYIYTYIYTYMLFIEAAHATGIGDHTRHPNAKKSDLIYLLNLICSEGSALCTK